MTTAMVPGRELGNEEQIDKLFEQIDMEPKLPRDLIIVRMEKQQLFAEARTRKRVFKDMLDQLKDELTSCKTFAFKAMYAKPVGKDEKGVEKTARGLSIHAAESIKCALGCTDLKCSLTKLDTWSLLISVTFTDVLSLTTETRQTIVERRYTGYVYENGRRTTRKEEKIIPLDRFMAVTVKAATSLLVREVILRNTPSGLRSELEDMVRDACASYMDDETFSKITTAFGGKGVDLAALERHVGKRADNWSTNDRVDLLGLWNGIVAGDVDPETIGEEDGLPTQNNKPIDATPAPAPKSKTLDELKAQLRDRANELSAGEVVDILGEGELTAILTRGVEQEIKDAEALLSNAILARRQAMIAKPKTDEPEKPAGVPIAEAPDGGTAAEAQGELPLKAKVNKKNVDWAK